MLMSKYAGIRCELAFFLCVDQDCCILSFKSHIFILVYIGCCMHAYIVKKKKKIKVATSKCHISFSVLFIIICEFFLSVLYVCSRHKALEATVYVFVCRLIYHLNRQCECTINNCLF